MQGAGIAAAIEAKGLACRRGDRLLFRGLNLTLGAGDACLVTGPNGTGKSSLLRVLAGLLRPYGGSVERKGSCALLDENLALDPECSLREALTFWHRLDCAEQPHAVYEQMSLTSLLDVPVRYLSTGQRKRAGLARLILSEADIWLLDEPLNGLDTEAQALVTPLVDEHRSAGGICIAASHQPLAMNNAQTLALEEFAL
ncbi:heme ABC exporter ATP-binding protein CcmA [Qipengyuania atrilutea]|uniref:Heme ABC exporter ATP-binding protein CcmA n=1 Tax=Qipengyuania atrilutea TaxID=2744473 RepID=A0A850H8C4_9SPHN|nr:heme ABC exporter ATP-binding protein CcmA [Actirhodobacter atriluteus]NVD45495.1 heme ABC exporter ATP-binding protein CcmA [Actirhodobacter atriluteus]